MKFKSSYKIRCSAEGDFGEDEASGRIRFRGKGQLVDGILVAPFPAPRPGPLLEPFPIERPGTGGAVFEIVQVPSGGLVVREDPIELDPGLRPPGGEDPIRGGGVIGIEARPGEVVLRP